MRLHSPTFETALRRSVKRTVQGSPELKRELRRSRKARSKTQLGFFVRPAISFALGYVIWNIVQSTDHAQTGLAILALWGFGLVFTHALGLLTRLFTAPDLPTLFLLPVAEHIIFRWELQKFIRIAFGSLLDFFAGYLAVACYLGFGPTRWLGAVVSAALLSWVTVISLAMLCAAHFPRWPYRLFTVVFVLGVAAILIGRTVFWEPLLALLDRHAATINLVLPTGWTPSLFSFLLPESRLSSLWLSLPVIAVLWTVKSSLARLGTGYQFLEATTPEAPDLLPQPEAEIEGSQAQPLVSPTHLGPTAIEEIIQSRQFLAPQWSQRGWLEKRLWHWLTPRQRALAEFCFPSGFAITASWKKLGRNFCVALLLGLGAGLLNPVLRIWVLGFGLFITFCHALALMLATGRAFQPVGSSGVNMPRYAGFGLGFLELIGFFLKCSLMQLPLFLPFALICGAVVGWLAGIPPTDGALYGLKAGWLVFAGRFIALIFGFSSGTNDSQRFRLRSGALLLVMLGGIGLFLLLAVSSFLITSQILSLGLLIGALVESYLLCRLYGWFYRSNSFDLMNLTRS